MKDNTKYEVIRVHIESMSFDVMILKLPENELDDRLTYLTRDKGLIEKSKFDDFLIATCITNVNAVVEYLQQTKVTLDQVNAIRLEMVDNIIKVNPLLDPNNMVINKNNVVKISKRNNKSLKKLTDNELWMSDIYATPTMDNSKLSDIPHVSYDQEDTTKNKKVDTSKIRNLKDISYVPIQKFWKRLGQYVTIKQFSEIDADVITGGREFPTLASYRQYIVTVCVEDIEDLFQKLDQLGLPKRVPSQDLIYELYDLCIVSNQFLAPDANKALGEPDIFNQQKTSTSDKGLPENNLENASKIKLFKQVKKETLLGLSSEMKTKVIGQDHALDVLVDAIQRASVGLKDPDHPLGAFVFAGYSGTGKTHAAKVLAEALTGSGRGLVTVDCSEYSADHEYAKLIGCFIPGTKVLMSNGGVSNIEDLSVGDKVITHKGRIREIKKLHVYDQCGEMVKFITANSNIPITTTKTHEILAIKHSKCLRGDTNSYRVCKPTCNVNYCVKPPYEKYKLEWTPADKLEKDDIVVYPRYKSTNIYPDKIDLISYIEKNSRYKYDDEFIWAQSHVKIPRYVHVNEDLARLAGYYVSEGGISGVNKKGPKTINFTFNSKESDYIIEVVKLLRRIFGSDMCIRIDDRTKNGSYRIFASSRIVSCFMSDLFGNNTYVKRLPDWFKDLPDIIVKNFLETAVFGDGSLATPRRMDYSTVSPNLFYQMELLFRRLGYITYKQLEHTSKTNNRLTDRYRLYISGNQIEQLNEEFNFNIDLSNLNQTNIQRKAWIDDDYVYFQIKDIDTVSYTGKVYDLSVEEDVSYITEISVHNSPAGYIGFEQGGYLTNAIKKQPFSIVLFDEIEKASDKVHQLLLQIMDEARLTDGKGHPVSFKDTIIVMTSNIGVKEVDAIGKTIGFGDANVITNDKRTQAVESALKNQFKPEFLNRLTSIINFNSLTKENYLQIIKLELEKLKLNLKLSGTEYSQTRLKFDESLLEYIYGKGIDESYGARPLKRYIEQEVSTPLARKLLQEPIPEMSMVFVSIKDGTLSIDVVKGQDDMLNNPPFYMGNSAGECQGEQTNV